MKVTLFQFNWSSLGFAFQSIVRVPSHARFVKLFPECSHPFLSEQRSCKNRQEDAVFDFLPTLHKLLQGLKIGNLQSRVRNFLYALTLAEFSHEIKHRISNNSISDQNHRAHDARTLGNEVDALQTNKHLKSNWREWVGRAFFQFSDGEDFSFHPIWRDSANSILGAIYEVIQFDRKDQLSTSLAMRRPICFSLLSVQL